jgi:hypothetical protein
VLDKKYKEKITEILHQIEQNGGQVCPALSILIFKYLIVLNVQSNFQESSALIKAKVPTYMSTFI